MMYETIQQQTMYVPVYTYGNKKYLEGYTLMALGVSHLIRGKKDQLYELTETQIKDIINKYMGRNPSIRLETQDTHLTRDELNIIYNEDLDRDLDLQIEEQKRITAMYAQKLREIEQKRETNQTYEEHPQILESMQPKQELETALEDYFQIIKNANSWQYLSQQDRTIEIDEEEQVSRLLN